MENNVNVQELINDIKENLKQKSASRRDEETVMRAMLMIETLLLKIGLLKKHIALQQNIEKWLLVLLHLQLRCLK